ncbi:hypothetical protein STXM2123_398 [Streptomyces sp. F-3]|nr:hypothetical protein STXM2123_398 [Streptomyces sp. F-3]
MHSDPDACHTPEREGRLHHGCASLRASCAVPGSTRPGPDPSPVTGARSGRGAGTTAP